MPNTAKGQAIRAWYQFGMERGWNALIPDWRTTTAPDGSPRIVAEVVGSDAARKLQAFAGGSSLVLGGPGDLRPSFDYSTAGRVACVWRSAGVWVELWHPDTATAPVAPLWVRTGSPSARLPFGRYSRLRRLRKPIASTKEN